jgi:hypothetical protein
MSEANTAGKLAKNVDLGDSTKESSSKKPRQHIDWTPQAEFCLVSCVKLNEAYKKTNISKEKKWQKVADAMSKEPFFAMYDPAQFNGGLMRKKYERMEADVMKKYSLSAEGANLSALDKDFDTETEKFIFNCIVDAMLKEEEKEK